MSQMLKSSGAMGVATLISRVLGLVREQVYAGFMGDGVVASAFKLAYQAPNLFRRLLGEGALTAAFIPIFKQKERTEGEAAMWESANAVLSGLILFASIVVGVCLAVVSLVLAAGSLRFSSGGDAVFPPFPIPVLGEDTRLVLRLLQVMLPYLLLVCVAALCMGSLNARGYFFVPAMSATMLNVVLIAAVLLLAPRFGDQLETQVFALALGVVAAGVAQLGFQWPTLRKDGFRYRWVRPWNNPTVREVVRRMLPATVGVAAFQLNVLIIAFIAFYVDRTLVASFDYAVRLMEFPQGVVGISFATYLLPTLSGLAAEKKYPEFRATLREGLGYLLFVNLLAAALLLALAEPMVRLLFERGQFTASSTHRAAMALAGLAPGLVAFSSVNVLARAFYALGDTQTPMKISVACLVLNLVCSMWLIGPFRQLGLGMANSITAYVNVWLLMRALRKKMPKLDFTPLRSAALRPLAIAAVTAVVAWSGQHLWGMRWGHATLPQKLGEVFVPMAVAAFVYWGLALALRVPQAKEVSRLVFAQLRKPRARQVLSDQPRG